MQTTNTSEVARIKAEIELNNAAARYAMQGTALGTAKHCVITAKMERMGMLHDTLAGIVGSKKADKFLVQVMEGGISSA
jgi:hypothetical protein